VTVAVSNPGKVLFPDAGLTKADLTGYYERVAEHMLPHVAGRPVSMQRFPSGIDKGGFFHKDVPDHFPDWVARVEVGKKGGTVTHAITCDADTLVYLANYGTITPHVWLSRAAHLDRPDRLVFDLDPSVEDFAAVRSVARDLGDLLRDRGLSPFAMTTGSRGLHVWVPLEPVHGFDDVRGFARDVAAALAERRDDVTTEFRKAKRGDRLLIDINRNGYAQTAVPPYAVRPRPRAPVAMPLDWEELSDSRLRPDRWTIANAFRRLGRKGDPWADIERHATRLDLASSVK
jgi:bifunctional non-homologous end joining protein LigD